MLYKVLDEHGKACNGGRGFYYLPHDGQPGDWMPPVVGELVPCENGYHLATIEQLLHWLGPRIYEAEGRGDCVQDMNKIVYREVRLLRLCEGWNECTARLFACDCAERVLPLYERGVPGDMRPREAIEVARQFAIGEADQKQLDVAWDAAWAAAEATLAGSGVGAWVARQAARAAAKAAAKAAARDAELRWQADKLEEYLYYAK